jgi:DNA-binding beta-propeller fold protein YncE
MKNYLGTLCFAMLATTFTFGQTSEYKILNKIHLEGDGGWDYLTVDESTDRLFVSHSTQVQVVDLKTGKQAGAVSNLAGVHGIAIAADLNKAFISCGRDSSIVIVDLKTLAFVAKVKATGANPDAILYDPYSHKVFTFNGRSANATVVDALTYKVVATIPLDGKPEFSATDGQGKVFVNNEDKSMVYTINSNTFKVEAKWSIAPGEEPSGLAFDKANNRVFSVTDKLMVISDTKNSKVVTTVPIGESVDGVAFDPIKNRIYTSNGDGSVTVVQEVNPNEFKVVETIPTQKGARTIAINTKTHRIYLPTAEFGPAPAATKENPRPRPAIKPGTFTILEIGYVKD